MEKALVRAGIYQADNLFTLRSIKESHLKHRPLDPAPSRNRMIGDFSIIEALGLHLASLRIGTKVICHDFGHFRFYGSNTVRLTIFLKTEKARRSSWINGLRSSL